jgi:hypothetical protein
MEANDLSIQISFSEGSIYFHLAKGGGMPFHLQEVKLGEADLLAVLLEELAPARRHVERHIP